VRRLLHSTFCALAALAAVAAADAAPPRITHGVAAGDVTASSALVWARSSAAAEMRLEVAADPAMASPRRFRGESDPTLDGTALVTVGGLEPGTKYTYSVVFENENGVSEAETGTFVTAPAPSAAAPVTFVMSGDLGGQGYCRHRDRGYRIFRAMAALEPHFFIANGDMIYADGACPETGPGGFPNVPGGFPAIDAPEVDWTDFDRVREVYLDHWRYNRLDPHHRSFLARTPIYAQWDDHEVINDFGAGWATWSKDVRRAGYPNLVRAGRESLFAWNPITRDPDEPFRIYRSFRWGRDVELFLIDGRSYRSLNDLAERPERPKTLLGEEQLAWLADGLRGSGATWTIVCTDVPLSVPTGSDADLYGRDAFADGAHPWERPDYAARTGFEAELGRLLEILDAADVENVVFVATDVHYAMNLRYQVDADGDGDTLLFHELVAGPLNAAPSPTAARLDPTFRPVILYAEAGFFNFSYARVERRGADVVLTADVRGEEGDVRFGSTLELSAEKP
jgi:alkaline phosphatase D